MHRKCTARQIKCQDEVGKQNDAWGEARALLRGEYGLGIDRRVEADLEQLFFDLKRKLLKKMDEDDLALASDEHTRDATEAAAEDKRARGFTDLLGLLRRQFREHYAHTSEISCQLINCRGTLGHLKNTSSQEGSCIAELASAERKAAQRSRGWECASEVPFQAEVEFRDTSARKNGRSFPNASRAHARRGLTLSPTSRARGCERLR